MGKKISIIMITLLVLAIFGGSAAFASPINYLAVQAATEGAKLESERSLGSEEEYTLGLKDLEKEDIVEAMQHFLRALPNEEANKKIAENAFDYVDELMFAEEYQLAQAFMLEHPFDGYEQLLAECNDHCFLLDIAKGLNARWKISNQDTSIWPDKMVREWYQQLVECETQYLDKYMSLGFLDPQLANYAYSYIGALQSQMTGAAYYGIDSEKYNENWIDHGSNVRARLIYLINKKYGIEIDTAYNDFLKETVSEGYNIDYVFAVTKSLTDQLSSLEYNVSIEEITRQVVRIEVLKFPLKNTSGYDLFTTEVGILFLAKDGTVVCRPISLFPGYLNGNKERLRDGEDLFWTDISPDSVGYDFDCGEAFDSIAFECTFNDTTGRIHKITVVPYDQYAWNGEDRNNLGFNGYNPFDNNDVFTMEDINAYWTTHNDSYVPCIEFILRNAGGTTIREATIECVFIDQDSKKDWSREKYFAATSSDIPLQAGQGRSVVVYSGSGYEKKTRKVANLAVEIYVNGKPLKIIEITKP